MWQKLKCWIGFHEGSITDDVFVCRHCGKRDFVENGWIHKGRKS